MTPVEDLLQQIVDLDAPIFRLAVACEMIPMPSDTAFYQFLHKHRAEFPGVYRKGQRRSERMFTGREILRIRDMTINAEAGAHFFRGRRGRPKGSRVNSAIQHIMRQASG